MPCLPIKLYNPLYYWRFGEIGSHILSAKVDTGKTFKKSNLAITIKRKTHISFDPTIPLLEIYPKYILAHMQNDVCLKIFIAALAYNSKRLETIWISI